MMIRRPHRFVVAVVALPLLAACGSAAKQPLSPRGGAESLASEEPMSEPSASPRAPSATAAEERSAAPADAPSTPSQRAAMGQVAQGASPVAARRDEVPAPAPASVATPPEPPAGTEAFEDYGVNGAVDPRRDRLSTFAVDVDTASYSIARRKLREGALPSYASVRVEEFVNSFDYGDPAPGRGVFFVNADAAPSPFDARHHVVRVSLRAKDVGASERRPVHLVYLVDVSGSMSGPDRLGLAKKSLAMLTASLKPGDTVAICTYAGAVREVLAPTGANDRARILAAIESLGAGGSTAMSSGIDLAYRLASQTLVSGHVNHVVVLSDGDANVGPSSHAAILGTIAAHRAKGITLSTVGFGTGNYKDTMMEQLADKGDGNYTYIDSEQHARTVFATQADRLLQGVARDVKAQVDFDPEVVQSYRLIGYENRDVRDRDFRNDAVDGGEVGAGHTVTAMYDVVLRRTDASPLTVRVRYKSPRTAMHGGSERATEEAYAMPPSRIASAFRSAPESLRFATAVAGFAEVLRQSPLAREWSLSDVARIGEEASAGRPERRELVALVQSAARLRGERPSVATVGIAR